MAGASAAVAGLAGLTVLGFLAACGGPQSATTFSAATRRHLGAAVRGVVRANDLPGAVAGVWVPGRGSWTYATGTADLASGRRLTAADQFRIASVTKTFTAELTLQLACQGRLRLSDPVSRYVSGVPGGTRITISELLDHTSGLTDADPHGILHRGLRDPLRRWTPRQVIDAYTGGTATYRPGTVYAYANVNYVLLGMVIQKASGTTVQRLLRRQITGPLGLSRTYFPSSARLHGTYAHGYDGRRDVTVVNMSWDWTAGAMVSTLADLRIWARAFGTGRLLCPRMFRQQQRWRAVPGGRGQVKDGLGMDDAFGFLGHPGANTGYQADAEYLPATGAVIVALTNRQSSSGTDQLASRQFLPAIAAVLYPHRIPGWYRHAVRLPNPAGR